MARWNLILLILSAIVFIAQIVLFFIKNYLPFDIIYIVLAGLATIAVAIAAKKSHSTADRKILFAFSAGFLLWTIAESIWMYYELVLGIEVPFPSFADLFWTIGYIPMLVALYLKKRDMFITKEKNIAAYVGGVIMLTFIIFIFLPLFIEMSGMERVLSFIYISFDYIFALFSLSVLLVGGTGKFIRPWLTLAAAYAAFTLFDISFAWFTAKDLYYTGHPIDLVYSTSYLLLTLAAYFKANNSDLVSELKQEHSLLQRDDKTLLKQEV